MLKRCCIYFVLNVTKRSTRILIKFLKRCRWVISNAKPLATRFGAIEPLLYLVIIHYWERPNNYFLPVSDLVLPVWGLMQISNSTWGLLQITIWYVSDIWELRSSISPRLGRFYIPPPIPLRPVIRWLVMTCSCQCRLPLFPTVKGKQTCLRGSSKCLGISRPVDVIRLKTLNLAWSS